VSGRRLSMMQQRALRLAGSMQLDWPSPEDRPFTVSRAVVHAVRRPRGISGWSQPSRNRPIASGPTAGGQYLVAAERGDARKPQGNAEGKATHAPMTASDRRRACSGTCDVGHDEQGSPSRRSIPDRTRAHARPEPRDLPQSRAMGSDVTVNDVPVSGVSRQENSNLNRKPTANLRLHVRTTVFQVRIGGVERRSRRAGARPRSTSVLAGSMVD